MSWDFWRRGDDKKGQRDGTSGCRLVSGSVEAQQFRTEARWVSKRRGPPAVMRRVTVGQFGDAQAERDRPGRDERAAGRKRPTRRSSRAVCVREGRSTAGVQRRGVADLRVSGAAAARSAPVPSTGGLVADRAARAGRRRRCAGGLEKRQERNLLAQRSPGRGCGSASSLGCCRRGRIES